MFLDCKCVVTIVSPHNEYASAVMMNLIFLGVKQRDAIFKQRDAIFKIRIITDISVRKSGRV